MMKTQTKNKGVIYLSGPMTGWKDNNAGVFNLYTTKFRKLGYTVINPVELDKVDYQPNYSKCLARDLHCILQEYLLGREITVGILDSWDTSQGAIKEILLASWFNIRIKTVQKLLEENNAK